MAITARGFGAAGTGTTSAAGAWVAGSVGDAIVAMVGNKPFSSTPTAPDGTWTQQTTGTSGSVANAVSSGSVRATSFTRRATATGTGTATFSVTSGSPTLAKTHRFGFDSGAFDVLGFTLTDTDETLTTVSATGTIGSGDVVSGDYLCICVVVKDDAITHTAPTFSVAGATHPAITWQTPDTTTSGNDGAIITAVVQMSGGSSTGTVTYSATSGVAGASATAVSVVRLREVMATPTGLAASGSSTSQIDVSWNSVTSATGYILERSPNGTSSWTTVYSSSGTSYSDTGLSTGTVYYYRVSATGSLPTSSVSSTVSASTLYPMDFSDDFSSGTWNKWVQVSSGGTAGTVVSGAGVLAADGGNNWKGVTALASSASPIGALLRWKHTDATNGSIRIALGYGTWNNSTFPDNIADGYEYQVTATDRFLTRYTSGAGSSMGSQLGTGFTANTYYWTRMELTDSGIMVRTWLDGSAEPSTWDISNADTTRTPTRLQIKPSGISGNTATFDDVSFYAIASGSVPGIFKAGKLGRTLAHPQAAHAGVR